MAVVKVYEPNTKGFIQFWKGTKFVEAKLYKEEQRWQ
jgi:hypothetical protein